MTRIPLLQFLSQHIGSYMRMRGSSGLTSHVATIIGRSFQRQRVRVMDASFRPYGVWSTLQLGARQLGGNYWTNDRHLASRELRYLRM